MNTRLKKKQHFLSLLTGILLIPLLGLFSCEDPSPDPTSNKEEVLAEEGTFFPMEIAQLSLKGEKAGTEKVQGTLNNQPVEIHLQDSVMLFVMPDIAPGVYQLEAPSGDKMLISKVTVKELVLSSAPDQIFQQIVEDNTETIQHLTTKAESLPEPDKAALLKDIQTLNSWKANIGQHYASLSPEEKENFAKTVVANKWWLDEIHSAVVELSTHSNSLRTTGEVDDYCTRVWDAALELRDAKNELFTHAQRTRIAAGLATGALVAVTVGASPLVGAAVGAGLIAYRFGVDYTNFNDALDNFYGTMVQPFDDMFSSERRAASKVTFVSEVAKEMETSTGYRNLYAQDKGSSIPIVQIISDASNTAKDVWETFSPSLPTPLQSPTMLDDIQSYNTTERAVHSKYLDVSDISNDNVALVKKEEKDGLLVLTFENNTATTQEFTYKLTFTDSRFSPGFSTTISAEVIPSKIIGEWEVVSMNFTLYDEDGVATSTSESELDIWYLEFTADGSMYEWWPEEISGTEEEAREEVRMLHKPNKVSLYELRDNGSKILTSPHPEDQPGSESEEDVDLIYGEFDLNYQSPDKLTMTTSKILAMEDDDGVTIFFKYQRVLERCNCNLLR
ncbi:hypothetical protein [Pontibacter pamirensis]|uniref:hypothetical protein n=1 Tax=Pontibacter pamirensis TaxID=2562824 RepID=UPI0013898772|nr:hypothetical protein [Pontibacter pamirensis]